MPRLYISHFSIVWWLAHQEFHGLVVAHLDHVDAGCGQVEGDVVRVMLRGAVDELSQEVVDLYGLIFGSLDGDAMLLREDEVAALIFGRVDAHGVGEIGDEEGVLGEDDGTRVLGGVVVPAFELVAVDGYGGDGDGLVDVEEAVAEHLAAFFVLGDDAGVDFAVVVGAVGETDVVAVFIPGSVADDGVVVHGVGVLVGG